MKGLYAKARAGEIPEFTGVSDPYEPPLAPRDPDRDRGPHPRRIRGRSHRLARGPQPRLTPPMHPEHRAVVSSDASVIFRAWSTGAQIASPSTNRWCCRTPSRARGGLHEVGDGVVPGLGGPSASGTEKAPSAMHSVAAGLTDHRGGNAGRRRGARAPPPPARAATATTTLDVDSPNAASAAGARPGAGRGGEVDPEPGVAAERHLAQGDREPAVAHVVHAGDLAAPAPARRPACAARAAASRSADGRRAAVEAVHDRGPLRAAELGPGLAEHDDRLAAGETAEPGSPPSSSSIRPSTPTTGVGWMSAPLDAL